MKRQSCAEFRHGSDATIRVAPGAERGAAAERRIHAGLVAGSIGAQSTRVCRYRLVTDAGAQRAPIAHRRTLAALSLARVTGRAACSSQPVACADSGAHGTGRGSVMSQDDKTFDGQCFCGAVRIVVTGDAVGAGYCHCVNCRSWSAGPVNAFTLWKPEAVKVTGARSSSGSTARRSGASARGATSAAAICSREHPTWELVDVYAATTRLRVQARDARELCGDRAAGEGRAAEAARLPDGDRRDRPTEREVDEPRVAR